MDYNLSRTWFDRFIGFFSPSAEFRRIRAKAATGLISRSYDAASKGRRAKNWNASSSDADIEISASLRTLRNRSRDSVRNNAYAARATQAIVSNCVGTGIILRIENKSVEKSWKAWSESALCDLEGSKDFYALQSLAFQTMVESGEVLIRKIRTSDPKSPIKLQILEPDYLDTTKLTSSNNIRDGIEFDDNGKPIAYWLFKQHPGGRVQIRDQFQSVRVPADEIIHLFRKERPGQIRGVPWGASAMLRLRDFSEYESAQLVRQKIAACFVGFLTDNQDPINQTSTTEEQKPMSERFEPGAWEVLPPGKDIKFGVPPGVGMDYDPYSRRSLQYIASGYGITYECLTGDYSNVNFSSGRMGWIDMHRNIEAWRWITFIPQFCEGVFAWWVEGMNVANGGSMPKSLPHTWTPPRREMIDPTKEVPAMKDAVRSGFATLSDTVRQLGFDPESHFKEIATDNEMLDSLNIVLDSDPRKDAQINGQTNQSGSQNGGNQ